MQSAPLQTVVWLLIAVPVKPVLINIRRFEAGITRIHNYYRALEHSSNMRMMVNIYFQLNFHICLTWKLLEKSRDCHNHNPQPNSDTKRKSKRTKINACTIKQTNAREAHRPALSSPSEVSTVLKGPTKHENKEKGKPQHETPRTKTHKTTQNKNNTRDIALERSVA